ncbi:MAG: hypothetical protein JO303_03110, partial [Caulobacteraceae bacterium]|nr:hypothetical protein [Caulobacteraceae bacterium]
QTAVRDLCKVVDLLIVVGASYSSNSRRLCEIGREIGIPSYLVNDGGEVDPKWLEGVKVVGLTAGASAPEHLVQTVITALRELDELDVRQLDGVEESVEFRLPAPLRPRPIGSAGHLDPTFHSSVFADADADEAYTGSAE